MRRQSYRTPAEIIEAGLAHPARRQDIEAVAARYSVAVTPAMADLVAAADSHDPIAAQFVPAAEELVTCADETEDPIGDHTHEAVPGLIHRYPDRVLLKLVGVCAVYCRFCFRREMVGPEHGATLSDTDLQRAFDYIRATPAVWEVILSGGDPLMLSPRRIAEVTAALATIEHVKVLRWHTRLPAVAPERITADLAESLRAPGGKAVFVALHANHPRELTPAARAACAMLIDAGIPMVSQSVLLAGINDDAMTLEALMRAFVETRIKPYYLHHLDRAPGTSHFRASIAHGQQIVRDLRGTLSGLAQPMYVLDIPGGHGKVPIGPQFVEQMATGDYAVTDPGGCEHCYREIEREMPRNEVTP